MEGTPVPLRMGNCASATSSSSWRSRDKTRDINLGLGFWGESKSELLLPVYAAFPSAGIAQIPS